MVNLAAKITIVGTLPDLNTEIDAAKKTVWIGKGSSRRKVPGLGYARQKQKWTNNVAWQVKEQAKHAHVDTFCSVVAIWYLKDKMKDPDNVYFAQKYLYDGMVAGGLLPNDNYRHTHGGIVHLVNVDRRKPRVELFIFKDYNLADLILPFVEKHNFNLKIQYDTST